MPGPEHRWLIGLLPLTIGLSLTACSSDDAQQASTTPSTGETTTSATSAPASSATTAAAQKVVIAPDGLGVVKFGDPADVALAKLKQRFGEPKDLGETSCAPRITHSVEWDDSLTANFTQTFVGYGYIMGVGGPPLRTETGIGEGSTVADLKAAYGSKVTFTPDSDPEAGGRYFKISLTEGTINGYAGSKDTDMVLSLLVGEDCGE